MDSILDDIKKHFYKKLKEDIKQKIEVLERDNKFLKKRVNELSQKLNKYKSEESKIRLEISQKRLNDLFKEIGMFNVLYSITWKSSYMKKCDKCDNYRKLHYKTPRGKDASEMCECGEYKRMFYPIQNELVRFTRNTWGTDQCEHPIFLWFEETDCDREEFRNERLIKHIYNNESYEEIFKEFGEYNSGLFFKSKEDCQNYCDWLGKKFGWTPDMIYDSTGNEIKI